MISFGKTSSAAIIVFTILSVLLSVSGSNPIQSIASSPPFPEGAHWTYQSIWEARLSGIGSCTGSQTYVEVIEGRIDVKKSNESALLLEDTREVDLVTNLTGCSCHFSGGRIFRPSEKTHYTQIISESIDRKKLTYSSFKVGADQNTSMIGMPATEFVNTSNREGQVAPYCFKKQGISCIVNYRSLRFQDADISVIMLHYSGPSKVSTPMIAIVTNASLKGAGDYTFNFEKETGVLISYSIKESAPLLISSEGSTFNMSRCAITITNSGNYTIKSEPWKNYAPTPTTTLPPASKSVPERPFIFPEIPYAPFLAETSEKYARSQWTLTLIVGGIAIAAVGVLVLRKFKR